MTTYCAHCGAELAAAADSHYANDGALVCGTCYAADFSDALDADEGRVASHAFYKVSGAAILLLGLVFLGLAVVSYAQGGAIAALICLGAGVSMLGFGARQFDREY
jgi:hypothetical protein